VADRSLAKLMPTYARHIANDERMRFCRSCMASGFQASTCQIMGLSTCLIHDEPLLSNCLHCSAPTPPYRQSTALRLNCASCGWSWCGSYNGSPRQTRWGGPIGIIGLECLSGWLASLENDEFVHWRNLDVWNIERGAETWEWDSRMRERGVAIFDTLLRLVPEGPASSPGSPVSTLGPFWYSCNATWRQPRLGEYEKLAAELEMLPTDDDQRFAQHFTLYSDGVPVPTNPIVPPEVHARVLWRAQFEGRVGFGMVNRHQVIIDNGLLARLLGFEPSQSWFFVSNRELTMGLLQACKEVALRAARRWHQSLLLKGTCLRPYELLDDHADQRRELGFWSEWDHHPIAWVSLGKRHRPQPSNLPVWERVYLAVL
ncbi:hypothetical protein LNV07_24645, partial [Paucibacter oligotrophus]|nr:hypothetical protein [Roseateles oligotrophus]